VSDAVPGIPRAELHARVETRDPDLVLIDVLAPDSYAAGHIPTAINLPYAAMSPEAVRAALPDRHADIVVYCGGFT
jgi:rhodanese-related sulfurtransferase